jgi:hypothetical protein
MTYELKDWLNSINFTKEDLSEDIKTYPPILSIVVCLDILIVLCMQMK